MVGGASTLLRGLSWNSLAGVLLSFHPSGATLGGSGGDQRPEVLAASLPEAGVAGTRPWHRPGRASSPWCLDLVCGVPMFSSRRLELKSEVLKL